LVDPDDLSFETPQELGISAKLLKRVMRALPKSWSTKLLEYPRLAPGDFVATTRNLPISRVLCIARVRTAADDPELITEYLAHEFFVDTESVLSAASLHPDALAAAPRLRVPLDHQLTHNLVTVVPHHRGLLVEALADRNELPSARLMIDQLIGDRVRSVPLSIAAVKGSRGALVALHAQRPTFVQWDPGFTAWARFFRRVWSPTTDHKVGDFLWRLAHRRLFLGHDRRRYSDDVDCVRCIGSCETYNHLLLDCPVTLNVFDWLDKAWRRLRNGTSIGVHSLSTLFTAIAPKRARTPPARHLQLLRSTVVTETIYALWLQRNRALHDEDATAFTIPAVCAVAKQRIIRATTTLSTLSFLKSHQFATLVEDLHRAL
jgi:hypothetical protein